MSFPLSPLEAGLSISTFYNLFTRTIKSFFIIYTPLMIVPSPKEITQRQALVNTIVKVS